MIKSTKMQSGLKRSKQLCRIQRSIYKNKLYFHVVAINDRKLKF